MEKEFWGKRVEAKVHAGERQIDASIRALMELVTEIQDGQADLNVSAVGTDPTLTKIMEAMAHLQEARSDLISAHRRVEQLGLYLGIRATGVGATWKPPQTSSAEEVVTARQANA